MQLLTQIIQSFGFIFTTLILEKYITEKLIQNMKVIKNICINKKILYNIFNIKFKYIIMSKKEILEKLKSDNIKRIFTENNIKHLYLIGSYAR
jgi:hypothetical protein